MSMSLRDEQELHRLGELLRSIDDGLDRKAPEREALQKAALALSKAFSNDLRSEIENDYEQIGIPLTDAQREHLKSMGIDPEE